MLTNLFSVNFDRFTPNGIHIGQPLKKYKLTLMLLFVFGAFLSLQTAFAQTPPNPVGFVANPSGTPGAVFVAAGPNNVGGNVVYRLFYAPTATAPANPLTATQYIFGSTPGDGNGLSPFGFVLGGLTPGTSYTFWLYQYNTVSMLYSAGNSSAVQTSGAAPPPPPPPPPSASPTTDPPIPTCFPLNVISIYSNSYRNIATNYDPNWGQSGHNQVNPNFNTGSGNTVLAYPNFNYQGTELTPTNASAMEFLHLDIWTNANPSATTIRVSPINFGTGAMEVLVTIPYTSGEWTSVVLPKSAFTGMTWDDVRQLKFEAFGVRPVDIYLDNIYFSNCGVIVEDCSGTSTTAVQGSFINGFSYDIITDGNDVKVNVELLDVQPGLVAFVQTYNPNFAEVMMMNTGGQTFTRTFPNQTPGTPFNFAIKFAWAAGGLAVSEIISGFVVGDCQINPPTQCTGTFTTAVQGDLGSGANYSINTNGNSVIINTSLIDTRPGLVAFIQTMNPNFAEVMMTNIGGQNFTYTFPNQTLGNSFNFAIKFAWAAGGLAVTNVLSFTVGDCPSPMPPAPTPTCPAGNVISMFSNAYNNVPVDTWRTPWSAATLEDIQIMGNDTKKYTNLNFVGIETTGANLINASAMTFFHLDVWSPNMTTFRVKLVDFGANGVFGGGDDTEHEIIFNNLPLSTWNTLLIPLSDFTGLASRTKIAQLIFSGIPVGQGTLFVDNVYFSTCPPPSPITAAPIPSCPAQLVKSMFSNAYTNLPVDTWRTPWSQSNFADIQIVGNDTKLYTNLNFVGIETTGANLINASDMTVFHLDVWTPNMTTFKVKLVDFGANGVFGGGDDTEHEIIFNNLPLSTWNSLSIPLSDFTGLTNRTKIAQLILSGIPPGQGTLFVDNVYFSRCSGSALPPGWSAAPSGVNCADGNSFTYQPITNVFTGTSTNCYYYPYSATSDAMAFAQFELCGNGSITAQVTSISESSAWAGVTMRENNAPGAKKIQLVTDAGFFNRSEYRPTTNGPSVLNLFRSSDRYWLRITRVGNQFNMHVSQNGTSWIAVGSQNIAMGSCIQVGLMVTNQNPNSTAIATFANVSVSNVLARPTIFDNTNASEAVINISDIKITPNPTNGEIQVDLSAYSNKLVQMELYNLQGKILQSVNIESNGPENIDLSSYTNGMYFIRVRSEGFPDVTKRVVLNNRY